MRFQIGTSEDVCGKECLRSQSVTSEETELEITNCDFKIKGEKRNGMVERITDGGPL